MHVYNYSAVPNTTRLLYPLYIHHIILHSATYSRVYETYDNIILYTTAEFITDWM